MKRLPFTLFVLSKVEGRFRRFIVGLIKVEMMSILSSFFIWEQLATEAQVLYRDRRLMHVIAWSWKKPSYVG